MAFTHIHRQQLKDLRNWALQQGAKQAAAFRQKQLLEKKTDGQSPTKPGPTPKP